MVGCWAFGCSNRSEHGLRFHTFPTCADRRKLWAQHVNRIESGSNPRSVKVLQPTKTAKLCEKHFLDTCYVTNEETGKKKLKSDAVPTLFDHVNTASHRPSPSKRRRLAVEQHLPTVEPHAVDATSGEPSVSTNVDQLSPPLIAECDQTSKRIEILERKLKQAQKEKRVAVRKLEQSDQKLHKIFGPDQLTALTRRSTRGLKWEIETVKKALKLRFVCGTAGYNEILSSGIPLPSARTLQERLQNISFQSGVLLSVFDYLKEKVHSMRECDRLCCLSLDEMEITTAYEYDAGSKQVLGDVTLPGQDGAASHGLVVMLGGIAERWKQVVAYHLTGRSTPGAALRSLVDAVVLKAHGIGLQVVNVTTDMGPSNQAMWKAYNIGCSRDSIASFCKHPVHADLKLHFMADVPHLVKNMCTALMRHKVFTINVEIAQEHNLPSNTVNVSHLIDLAQFQHDKDLKLAPNLSLDILTSSSHFKKMNVGRALHIFSKSVSAGLRYLIENEQRSTDYLCTAWFVELVDRWFDLMSSRHPVMALSPQKTSQYTDARDHLACFMKVVKTFQVGDMSSWKPIQTGVLLSTTTVLNLCDELLASRLEFLLTSRLTQDCVENLFSIVRSRHPTPTGREFKYALKLICTAQYLKPVKHSNYHMDEREFLGELLPAQIVPPLVADTELDDLQLSSTESLDDAEKNSLYYLAGYCVHSLLRCNQICTNCADSIRHSNNDEITAHPMSTLLRHKNFKEGALVEVGIDIFSSVLCWEDIVRSYETAFKARNICQRVIDVCLEKTSPPDNIPSCHSLFRKLVTKFVTVRLHIICKKKTAMQKRSTTIPHGSRSMAMRALAERL